MNEKKYKYDVAFSFVQDDEPLARAVNDLIQERAATFLYSKRQEEIAGTDGEKTFATVFGEESRTVVVLYRGTWGTTPWTRIEETAIRNRAFLEGYDFVIFMPVEKGATLPKWLPKTQLWIGLERWGIEGAASVIEARIQQAGGEPREESAQDRAARLKRHIDSETARNQFLDSADGVASALKAVTTIFETIECRTQEITESTGLSLRTKRVESGIELYANEGGLAVEWHYLYQNTLNDSYLSVSLWNGIPYRPERMFIRKPSLIRQEQFNFDRENTDMLGWQHQKQKLFLTSEQLADHCLKVLMDYVHQQHMRKK